MTQMSQVQDSEVDSVRVQFWTLLFDGNKLIINATLKLLPFLSKETCTSF